MERLSLTWSPSGGGLTSLPTYSSLMPIDKWVVRCAGCSSGEAAGERETGTTHHVSDAEPESWLLLGTHL